MLDQGRWRLLHLCLIVTVADCANSSSADSLSTPSGSPGTGGSTSGAEQPAGSDISAGRDAAALPAEMEVENAFEAPVATQKYVWAANPKSGRVALIDATTFKVRTESVGDGPTYLSPVPGASDRAIVLNVLSHDATLLTYRADTLEQRRFAVAPGANAWAVSGDGHFAIAWTDARHVAHADRIEPFQQVSIIDLTDPAAAAKAPVRVVGFRPSSIAFSSAAPRAYAVTEEGISVIDLSDATNPVVRRTIKLSAPAAIATGGGPGSDAGAPSDGDADAVSEAAADSQQGAASDSGGAASDSGGAASAQATNDVTITKAGDYAVVRYQDSPVVGLVNLGDGTQTQWSLSGPVTDLDLSASGHEAIAVVRSTGRVTVLPLPGSAQTRSDHVIEGETIGSVSIAPQGNAALLYTNAVPSTHLTLLDLATAPTYRVIELHAPVLSVFPTDQADYAVVVHSSFNHSAFTSAGAFSLVPLKDELTAALTTTDAPPMSVALAPAGDRAVVTVRDDQQKIYGAYLGAMPSLVTQRVALASPPTSAGFVGDEAFISQEHPEGRITFIEHATGRLRTITGFELGASVVEWSPHDGGQP